MQLVCDFARRAALVVVAMVLAAVFLLAVARPAGALLISTDWMDPDDGLLTRDTVTGLEWLDLSVTTGMSTMDVFPQLDDPGSVLYGFHYAEHDIDGFLFDGAGLVPTHLAEENLAPAQHLIDMVGVTVYGDGGELSYGAAGVSYASPYLADECAAGMACESWGNTVTGVFVTDNPQYGRVEGGWSSIGPDAAYDYIGHFLVRTARVPGAPAVLVLGLGLIGLTLLRRRPSA